MFLLTHELVKLLPIGERGDESNPIVLIRCVKAIGNEKEEKYRIDKRGEDYDRNVFFSQNFQSVAHFTVKIKETRIPF